MTRSYRRWTEEDDRRILEYVSAHGPRQQGLADFFGVTQGQIHNHIEKYLRARYVAAVEAYDRRMAAQREVAPPTHPQEILFDQLRLAAAPFAVPVPAPAKLREGERLTAVVFGDTHVPYQDDGALACVEAIIRAAKPDVLIHLGDLVDASQISEKFLQDPEHPSTLKQDIEIARTRLHQWARLAPKAQKFLLEGNHEDRLRRLIWGLQGAQRELALLGINGWPDLLQLADIGWTWIPYHEQPARGLLPKLLVKHGDVVSQWAGFTAKREWMAYGHSGISGHTHRAIAWPHTDDNGVARWIEAGCTCRYDIPWATRTDWQQAVTVLEWNADRYLMNVEQPYIRNGQTLWRGREYRA